MAENNCRGNKTRRGAKGSPPMRFVFMKPANDNRTGVAGKFKRFLALIAATLLAAAAFWANS